MSRRTSLVLLVVYLLLALGPGIASAFDVETLDAGLHIQLALAASKGTFLATPAFYAYDWLRDWWGVVWLVVFVSAGSALWFPGLLHRATRK